MWNSKHHSCQPGLKAEAVKEVKWNLNGGAEIGTEKCEKRREEREQSSWRRLAGDVKGLADCANGRMHSPWHLLVLRLLKRSPSIQPPEWTQLHMQMKTWTHLNYKMLIRVHVNRRTKTHFWNCPAQKHILCSGTFEWFSPTRDVWVWTWIDFHGSEHPDVQWSHVWYTMTHRIRISISSIYRLIFNISIKQEPHITVSHEQVLGCTACENATKSSSSGEQCRMYKHQYNNRSTGISGSTFAFAWKSPWLS